MSTDSDKQERSRLQHEAEHERPHKRSSVLLYLVILFAAAFLLLLMSYFMQQRANQEAMDKLEQTSDSATQSLENILQENETLVQLEALCYLNQIRALYNDGRYSDARDAAAAAEAALAGEGGMEGVLGTVADGLTDQQRQDYNPLEAYQSLMEWLG